MTTGTITVNPDSPERFLVEIAEGETLEIGRKASNDGKRKLVLPYPEVSSKHAEIRSKPQGWTILDSGSTNGTSLNGVRLVAGKEYSLNSGDRVEIAQYELIVSPPNIIHQIEAHPDIDEAQDRTQFRINLINATILVGDIKGFTSLMEVYATDPSVVMQAAQQVFEAMSELIRKNYGQVEKIAGDAIMAYWHGDDSISGATMQAYQACKTAIDLQAIVRKMANARNWPFPQHPLLCDLAMATGPVAAGAIGQGNANPALLGDTANLVFRLEKLIIDPTIGDIVVESQTYQLAKSHFEFESLGQFNVKGRQRPVDVYRLLRPIAEV
jgi:class 3 adenylate cyclase